MAGIGHKQQIDHARESDLASDVLRGAQAIADYVGLDIRRCFYKLEKGFLPAVREGGTWVSTRSRLRAFYDGDLTVAPAKPTELVALEGSSDA